MSQATRWLTPLRLSVLAMILTVLLAACGSESTPAPASTSVPGIDSTPAPTPEPTATATLFPTSTSTATPATPPSPAPTGTPATPPSSEPTGTPAPPPTPTPSPDYPYVLGQPISEVWDKDAELAAALVEAPWLADGIGRLEPNAVYGLLRLYDWDPELAWQVLNYSIEEPVRSRNVLILNALGDMTWQNPDSFELLLQQPWFIDGLDAEERAFIIALQKIADPGDMYNDFLRERVSLRSRASGVDIWVFHRSDAILSYGAAIPMMVAQAVEGVEQLIGASLPVTDVIILMYDADKYGDGYFGGVNFSDSMLLALASGQTPRQRLIDHEVSHYFLAGEVAPLWLVEGGANFAAAYLQATRDGNEVMVEEWVPEECADNGVPNIHALANPNPPDVVWRDTCDYTLGQYFLTTVYKAIGQEAYGGALRELHERYVRYERPATEEQIYNAFLRHTPEDRKSTLIDVYRRLHGGPFTG